MAGEVAGFTAGGFAYTLGLFMIKAGGALIDNMAWLFAIGVAIGMSDDNDGHSSPGWSGCHVTVPEPAQLRRCFRTDR